MVNFLVALLLFGVAAPGPLNRELSVDGVQRRAIIYPGRDSHTRPAPVIFFFHGHGGNAQNASRGLALQEAWPEATVVYPDGLPTRTPNDPQGLRSGWQRSPGEQGDRDLKFFDALLADIRTQVKVDDARIYACGFSNGGVFTHILWAVRGDTLAAVAPGGSVFVPEDLYQKARPLPALITNGENDQLVPIRAARASIAHAIQVNRCDPERSRSWDEGYTLYPPSPGGADLIVHIHPGGHTWPEGARTHIVRFFKEHPRQADRPFQPR